MCVCFDIDRPFLEVLFTQVATLAGMFELLSFVALTCIPAAEVNLSNACAVLLTPLPSVLKCLRR